MPGIVVKYTTTAGHQRWRARWDLPPGRDGARRQRTRAGFDTKREAQRFLREQLLAVDRGLAPSASKLTLEAYLTRWLEGKRLRPTTRDNYRTCLLVHVIPRIGGLKVTDLDHRTLDLLYRDLELHGKAAKNCRTAGVTCALHACAPTRHRGLSTKSIQLVHGAMRTALQDAVRDGILTRNPADLAQAPKRTAAQRRISKEQVWTAEQARRFLELTRTDRLHALWALALSTGLRRAELVGLTWANADLRQGSLEVRRTTTTVRGQPIASTGKTSAAQRRIRLDQPVTDLLARHRDRQTSQLGPPVGTDPVFTEPDGRPIHPGHLSKRFQALVRELGLPPIGVHGLRHTAATLMLNNGVPIHLVSNRLGHTDASTTLSVYVHVMPDDDAVAAKAISAVLFPSHPTADNTPSGPSPDPAHVLPPEECVRSVSDQPVSNERGRTHEPISSSVSAGQAQFDEGGGRGGT